MWQKQRNSFLWLHGTPGCGKTVLSSTIIKELQDNSSILLYFYFDFNDIHKQTFEGTVRSLIRQLYIKLNGNWKQLNSLFASSAEGQQQATIEVLYRTLLDGIKQMEEIWIVFDALDECREEELFSNKTIPSWVQNCFKVNEVMSICSLPVDQNIISIQGYGSSQRTNASYRFRTTSFTMIFAPIFVVEKRMVKLLRDGAPDH